MFPTRILREFAFLFLERKKCYYFNSFLIFSKRNEILKHNLKYSLQKNYIQSLTFNNAHYIKYQAVKLRFASILIFLFHCAILTKLTGRRVKYTNVVRHDEFAFAKVPPYSKFEFSSRGIHFAGSAPGLSQIYGNFLSRERAAYSEGRPSNINSNQSLFSHTTNLEELRSWFSDGSYYLLPTLLLTLSAN